MNVYKAVVFFTLASMGLSVRALACLDPAAPKGESRSTINLMTKVKEPYFYFRSSDYSFSILVEPGSVRGAVEAAKSLGDKDAEKFLFLIRGDFPLKQSTDLFRYVLKDYYQLSFIQRVLVVLLAQGKAAVFHAGTGELVPSIEMKRDNSAQGRARTFYGPNKEVLLQSLDCIAD